MLYPDVDIVYIEYKIPLGGILIRLITIKLYAI